MMGSETFGTRLLSKPRRDILHELEALMEEDSLVQKQYSLTWFPGFDMFSVIHRFLQFD